MNNDIIELMQLLASVTTRDAVRGARWSEINWERKEWIVPAARRKTRRAQRVPLSDTVLQRLRALPRTADCDLIFPNKQGLQLSELTVAKIMAAKPAAVMHIPGAAAVMHIPGGQPTSDGEAIMVRTATGHLLVSSAEDGLSPPLATDTEVDVGVFTGDGWQEAAFYARMPVTDLLARLPDWTAAAPNTVADETSVSLSLLDALKIAVDVYMHRASDVRCLPLPARANAQRAAELHDLIRQIADGRLMVQLRRPAQPMHIPGGQLVCAAGNLQQIVVPTKSGGRIVLTRPDSDDGEPPQVGDSVVNMALFAREDDISRGKPVEEHYCMTLPELWQRMVKWEALSL